MDLGDFWVNGEKEERSVERGNSMTERGKAQACKYCRCGARTLGLLGEPCGRAEEGSRTFILGIARVRRPSRVIGRVAATALGVFQMRQGSGVEGDWGPFLCILRLGR